MNKYYPNLFSPIRINGVRFKNRIIAAPTGMMDLTPDGRLTVFDVNYYELKAMGGAAAVTLGESITDTQTGESHNRQIHLDDPESMPGLTHVAMAIKRHGALANIELSHGGKYGGLNSIGGEGTADRTSYGPSEEDLPTGEHVYEMPVELIQHIVKAYGIAAKRVKDCGFDMINVHAGHGWLFNQFLSPVQNHRTDEFGGSLENRARFLMMALDECRKAVGPRFPIEVRMNGDDFMKGGMTLEDYVELAKLIEDKVDLFNISCGSHEEDGLFVRTHPHMFLKHGCNVYLAAEIKKHVNKPVAAVGAISTPELAEEIIASGQADMVEIGRELLADPYFPKKSMTGHADDITPCQRCYHCFENIVRSTSVECAVNPVIGHELDCKYYDPAPTTRKKVLIVGGGIGGMEAAITAAGRGHEVILCEKSDSLGGALKLAKYVDFKEALYELEQVFERRVRKAAVEIRYNTEVTPEYVMAEGPDVLIVAVGADPVIPHIPGVDRDNVILGVDAEAEIDKIGKKVAIIGGGLIGCETAINLGMQNRDVTIIEMRSELAPEANMFHKMAVQPMVEKYTTAMTGVAAKEFNEKGVVVKNVETGEEILVEADTIILSVGLRSRTEDVEKFEGLVDEYYPIGNCVKPGQVTGAIHDAYFVTRDL
ncbi:MAG: FAD-dependent oxidoreductase [Mobilibacterium timonense]|uniref:NAD(P)/FAD-dependent oxidoreductase n=1 Tax=Mobilibacterium timonense TaxID=1871012 RepID=UPI0009851B7B|nr:NAD(P)/FAD-dependent oxidoreductase [Mobilibacterium timonense]MBM6990351.1 FAD-dependent oxidoreductase [Mobilibacterium timonense]